MKRPTVVLATLLVPALAAACAEGPDPASEAAGAPDETVAETVAEAPASQPAAPAETAAAAAPEAPAHDYPGEPARGEPTTTASGLQYFDLREGTGAMPAGPQTKVRVHYTGWLLDGTKFDSSVDRGRPLDFRLDGVIRGWTEGVGSMKVGGKRKLVIPSDLAYGPRGRPGIPPNATLVFDVELLDLP